MGKSAAPGSGSLMLDPVLTWETYGAGALPEVVFATTINREGLWHLIREEFASDERAPAKLARLGTVQVHQRRPLVESLLVRFREGIAFVKMGAGTVGVEVAADGFERCERIMARFRRILRAKPPASEAGVTFWAHGCHQPTSTHRRISAPAWAELRTAYAPEAAKGLEELVGASAPARGRLLLWHSPPGTGKTHALKALIREWRSWCATHFVSDPEVFLGQGNAYLMEVLTASDWERPSRDWRLVVLEDAGELLSVDARAQTGQALSRLLNLTDGLIGQGMNVIVLVTTNEPLARLHPAVARSGRCWMDIEFGPCRCRRPIVGCGRRGRRRG